jgi:predicted transcriptional regulator
MKNKDTVLQLLSEADNKLHTLLQDLQSKQITTQDLINRLNHTKQRVEKSIERVMLEDGLF